MKTNLVKSLFNRHANQLHNLEFIFSELATRVVSRLDYIRIRPQLVLDCGSGLGYDAKLLSQKYPAAKIIQLDIAKELLKLQHSGGGWFSRLRRNNWSKRLVCAEAGNLPIADSCIDLVYSNMLLPYLDDLTGFMREMQRVLTIGGGFFLAGLGVDSFKELRALGLSSLVFPDMHDVGDMLLTLGFTNPVVDNEVITLDYEDLATLLSEVRLVGCGSAIHPLPKLTPAVIHTLKAKTNLPAKLTLEVFVAHAWKDQERLALAPGIKTINFIQHKSN